MPASRSLFRLTALAIVVTALAGCDIAVNGDGGLHFDVAAGKAQDEWSRTYQVPAGGRLELINVNGRITAEASEGTTVEVRAERSAKAATDEGARSLLDRIEMREEVGEGRVRVEVRTPRISGPSSHQIQWTVKVPRGVNVDLRTVNGGIKLQGLDGEVRARSTNGGITGAALLATAVDASVTNGGVEIALAHPATTGTFELEAVNGGISLRLPPTSKADLTARTVNGGIAVQDLDVQVSGDEQGRRDGATLAFRRRLDGQLNGGGARVSLSTVNGGVKIGTTVSTT